MRKRLIQKAFVITQATSNVHMRLSGHEAHPPHGKLVAIVAGILVLRLAVQLQRSVVVPLDFRAPALFIELFGPPC